jgi:hypothetical protein
MNPLKLQKQIDLVLDTAFNKSNDDYFKQARVIGCYDQPFELVKKIEMLKLKYLTKGVKEKKIRVSKGCKIWCCAPKVNAYEYYTEEIKKE